MSGTIITLQTEGCRLLQQDIVSAFKKVIFTNFYFICKQNKRKLIKTDAKDDQNLERYSQSNGELELLIDLHNYTSTIL